jgi:ATP-dependent RNA helicase RhlE
MSFDSLGLAPEITRALSERGYTEPTPIQAQAIPSILEGRDILAGAQTGTGKTAGFTVPILQRLHVANKRLNDPRVLILVPTRELAAQVLESVRSYGKYLSLRSGVVFGGVSINPQIDMCNRGMDILVATPGRLLDLVEHGNVDLYAIETFVLDEADRMLDMGFIHDIKRIMKRLPKKRQNLMFSATYSDDIRQLAQNILHDPVQVEVARRNTAVEVIEQSAYLVPKDKKRALLSHLIRSGDWSQVLVFTRTKHGANRLAQQLQDDGINTAAIHGNKSQNARTQALKGFKESRVRALVATEVAARGLDIKELPHVVNYELPNVPEDYVHRIGRTGRAGASGAAISLVAPDEMGLLKDIERTIRKTIDRLPLPTISTAPVTTSTESRPHTQSQPQRRPSNAPRSPQRSSSQRSDSRNPAARNQESPRSAWPNSSSTSRPSTSNPPSRNQGERRDEQRPRNTSSKPVGSPSGNVSRPHRDAGTGARAHRGAGSKPSTSRH